jgi:hypothetical protein
MKTAPIVLAKGTVGELWNLEFLDFPNGVVVDETWRSCGSFYITISKPTSLVGP